MSRKNKDSKQRSNRLEGLGTSVCVLALAAFCTHSVRPAVAGTTYQVLDLGAPGGGSDFQVGGLNNFGQVVGKYENTLGYWQPFIAQPGEALVPLAIGSGRNSGNAADITDAGLVVGESLNLDLSTGISSERVASYWQPGGPAVSLSEISWGTYDYSNAHAVGANASGQIAGNWAYGGGTAGHDFGGVIWQPDGSVEWLSGDSDGDGTDDVSSKAFAINDAGEITGYADTGGTYDATFWDADGSLTLLPAPSGYNVAIAHDVNAMSASVGYASDSMTWQLACAWDSQQALTLLETPAGKLSLARHINDLGQVVGYISTIGGLPDPVLWDPTEGLVYLQDSLAPSDTGWQLTAASAINERGEIVGVANLAGADPHLVLLTPVPEPATLALLGIGAVGVLPFARRRRTSAGR